MAPEFLWMNVFCVFQRKPEESPVKEGAVKKVKQEVKQEPPADKVDKASSETKGKTNSMEVERWDFSVKPPGHHDLKLYGSSVPPRK